MKEYQVELVLRAYVTVEAESAEQARQDVLDNEELHGECFYRGTPMAESVLECPAV